MPRAQSISKYRCIRGKPLVELACRRIDRSQLRLLNFYLIIHRQFINYQFNIKTIIEGTSQTESSAPDSCAVHTAQAHRLSSDGLLNFIVTLRQPQMCQSSSIIFKLPAGLHDFNCCHSFLSIILHLLHRVFLFCLFVKAARHRLTFFMLFLKSASVSLYEQRTHTSNFPIDWPALLACKLQKKQFQPFHLFFVVFSNGIVR